MRKQSKLTGLVLLVGALLVTFERGWLSVSDETPDFSPVVTGAGGWDLLEDGRLIEGRNSDGDSFQVKHEKGENEFRLYFVDAPESAYREYRGGENNGERLDEQAAYFGGLGRNEAVEVGKEAKDFVLGLLRSGNFKVLTKWENVYGPDRQYCLVLVNWQGKEVYLHELLVSRGLVRIHTRGADLPGGRNWRDQKEYLQDREAEVKAAGIGGWGK